MLLGNHRWIRRTLLEHRSLLPQGIVELGAGDGSFLHQLRRRHPTLPLTGFDLAPRPVKLPPDVAWHSGSAFQHVGSWPGAVLVANLFLHHFEVELIQALGQRLQDVRLLLVGEVHRVPDVIRRSGWLNPLLGEITRHDMEISLTAGFVAGELPTWLGLKDCDWQVHESHTLFGAHRLQAVRRD